jgi:molybdopterin-guanine dinucleotide biosynthesis protein A
VANRLVDGASSESASADSERAKIPKGSRSAAAADTEPRPLPATGILLVGGASERFGSPKALARFRGETLAQRAWRVLGETCEEALAVGKQADGLPLPFAVLDDGSPERAPVFGLIAGLRAATHEACVALPVDCPLVTPELLRALLDAGAVPQTGPLPGAYAKAMVPELESRVAAGELSLRGVNGNELEVDERLVRNVNTRVDLVRAEVDALDLDDANRSEAAGERSELTALSGAFWSEALWAARLLRRGEVFRSLESLDGPMKALLVALMARHARAVDPSVEAWDSGRLLERWADPGALSALERAYAHYDVRDVARALWETIDLFQLLEEETARRAGFELELDGAELRALMAEVVRDPRHGAFL